MTRGEGACLICGKPLVYEHTMREMTCSICRRKFLGHASCEDGHYVCDECHQKKGIESVMAYCRESRSRNPIRILQEMMEDPYIYMHGPEHHIMVGAALLTAYHNSGGKLDLDAALEEMNARGSQCPGGACGFWGCCGAAVSTGMYLSIVTGATPLTGKTWGQVNEMTARALAAISKWGGPRCCKRTSFTAVREAVIYTKELLGVEMELPETIRCSFSAENRECLRKACPYYPGTPE